MDSYTIMSNALTEAGVSVDVYSDITTGSYQVVVNTYKHDKKLKEEVRETVLDEVDYMLKNDITLDSILYAKDKFQLIAIFKRIIEQLKEKK